MTLLRLGSPMKKFDQKILTLNLIAEYQLSRRIFSTFLPFLLQFLHTFLHSCFLIRTWWSTVQLWLLISSDQRVSPDFRFHFKSLSETESPSQQYIIISNRRESAGDSSIRGSSWEKILFRYDCCVGFEFQMRGFDPQSSSWEESFYLSFFVFLTLKSVSFLYFCFV